MAIAKMPINKIINMKTFKTILIISIAIFGAGVLFVDYTLAQSLPDLVVQFEQQPLFSEANFLPGQDVTRWVKMTNNSGQTQRIATEAINKNDPNDFASQLNLTIKEGLTVIFDKTLAEFFSQGETYLSSLANGGAQTQYDFTITFNSGSGNDYQGKALGFDILVGFEGTEGGLPLPPPGGGTDGGGGGGLPPGLTITNETLSDVQQINVTITWLTSYNSTSQVIYGAEDESHTLDLNDNTGSPPKYGYAHTTPEYDMSPKITSHSVTITGLTPGTKYYYRAVSHASLAISEEYSFYTLAVANTEENKEEFNEAAQEQGETSFKENIAVGPLSAESGGSSFVGGEETGNITNPTTPEGIPAQPAGLLSAVGNIPLWGWILGIIFALIIIIGLLFGKRLFSRTRRE